MQADQQAQNKAILGVAEIMGRRTQIRISPEVWCKWGGRWRYKRLRVTGTNSCGTGRWFESQRAKPTKIQHGRWRRRIGHPSRRGSSASATGKKSPLSRTSALNGLNPGLNQLLNSPRPKLGFGMGSEL